jgi:hypothetical protein
LKNEKKLKKEAAVAQSRATAKPAHRVSNTNLPSETSDRRRNTGEKPYNALGKSEGERAFRQGKAGAKTSRLNGSDYSFQFLFPGLKYLKRPE